MLSSRAGKTTFMNMIAHNNRQPRGLALVVVIAAIAMASMIGYVMLSNSSIQAQMRHNAAGADVGSYVGESAVQAALYYLQYPSRIPTDWTGTSGYYIRALNQSLGSELPGTFDLEVKPTTTRDEYTISADGSASANSSPRTITARARVDRAKVSGAGHFRSLVTIPTRTTVTGKVEAEGSITNNSTSPSMTMSPGPLSATTYKVPTATTLNYYGADQIDGKYLCPDGTVGYAQKLSSVPTSTPVANSSNPGRVFYMCLESTDAVFTSPVTINGTLVIKGGGMSIRTSNVTINPQAGFPALIVDKDLTMYRTGVALEANGVVWIGRNIVWDKLSGSLSTGSTLTIKGSLLMPTSSPLGTPGSGGSMVIQYIANNAGVLDLSTALQPGTSVTIVDWN